MQTFGLSPQQQDEVWVRWRAGESLRSIARSLGINRPASVRCFVAATGGVRRPARRRADHQLSAAEREEISRGLAAKDSARAIARRLGRSASTVSREVARNGGRASYRAGTAEARAWQRGRRPKACKLAGTSAAAARLRARVEHDLAQGWSPQQIAARLRVDFGDDEAMRVSREAIYLSLFVQARGALRKELSAALRTGRAMRYPRAKRLPQGRGQLVDTVPISERPAEVEDRAVPGHWEGDLVFGARPSAIATLVERRTRFVSLIALPHGYKAEQVRQALSAAVQRLPEQLRRSLTWDRGKEMAQHAQVSIDTGVQVYFCDPHSPWQRGSNENTNGLLRQYVPKDADLRAFSQADLDEIAARLNGRPRQTLGWQTPSEALDEVVR
ncbi:IS30 family transposase [Kineococcus sp. SYSU DK005]|uniref:IS30 family transposase n=1 Tax=Kineococcus sp. SYSU DK005 TaxID=3383126 RepID=UPI003D7D7823